MTKLKVNEAVTMHDVESTSTASECGNYYLNEAT